MKRGKKAHGEKLESFVWKEAIWEGRVGKKLLQRIMRHIAILNSFGGVPDVQKGLSEKKEQMLWNIF